MSDPAVRPAGAARATEADRGERLDRFAAHVAGLTRAEAQRWLGVGAIRLNGRPARPSARLVAGDEVTWAPPRRPPSASPPAEPEPRLDIRYLDEDVLVLNKPRGLVVHPAPGHPHGTLVDLLEAWAEARGEVLPTRAGIMHRLDKDTTGLLLVARTPRAEDALGRAMRRHEVRRRYLALVQGTPARQRMAIDAPVGRDPRDRYRMAVTSRGRPAVTHVILLEAFRRASLVALDLETGRTHQIRVHLAAIGLPVLGDPLYGGRAGSGQLLHAARLSFNHPAGSGQTVVEAEPPPDFLNVLEALRRGEDPPS